MDLTPIASSLIILAHSITATYMGVDPAKVPQIKGAYTLPYEQVRNLCGTTCKTATGVYIEEEQKVYRLQKAIAKFIILNLSSFLLNQELVFFLCQSSKISIKIL